MPTINKPKAKRNSYTRLQRQKYYQLKQWKDLSLFYRMQHPICEECQEKTSEHTHHIVSPFQPNLSENERMALLLNPNTNAFKCLAILHLKMPCKSKM